MQTIEKPSADHPEVVEAALSEGASGDGCGRDAAAMVLILGAVAALVWWLL
jgi:hypothetical protein